MQLRAKRCALFFARFAGVLLATCVLARVVLPLIEHGIIMISISSVENVLSRSNDCQNLLDEGIFHRESKSTKLQWRPASCSLADYSEPYSAQMLQCWHQLPKMSGRTKTTIAFMGDSRLRQLAFEMVRTITGFENLVVQIKGKDTEITCDPPWNVDTEIWHKMHCNLTHLIPDIGVEVQRWFFRNTDSNEIVGHLKHVLNGSLAETPNVVVANAGAWMLLHCSDRNWSLPNCTLRYTRFLQDVQPLLAALSKRSIVIWMPQTRVNGSHAAFFIEASKNHALDEFNRLAEEHLADSGVYIWKGVYIFHERFGDTQDGLHLGPKTKVMCAQVLLNVLCNRVSFATGDSRACCAR